MTQSPEYPDLLWMPPRSWQDANRTSVQLLVIHDTEGSEGRTSAEDGAAYDQRRTDGTSAHYYHDQDSTVQCVRTADIAHTARNQGNRRGIHYELCGKAAQGAAGWADAASDGTLRQAARQVARDAKKWGIPIRHLTVAQVAAGEKGVCGHVDITYAFPQDNGSHTDPGPTFPWSYFLNLVRAEMEPDMPLSKTDLEVIANTDGVFKAPPGAVNSDGSVNQYWSLNSYQYYILKAATQARDNASAARTEASTLATALAALEVKVDSLIARPSADVDEAALAVSLAPLLNGTSAAEIESALRTVLRSV